jgi:glycosyltransferase involved in cell wall biosynthesis
MNDPLVSIGLPVYNGGTTLPRAIDSILAQGYKNFELLISDNASTDQTRLICEDYASKDSRVRYFRNQENIGVSPNHNRVFELSKGKYFSWSAHDVELLPGMIQRCVTTLEEAPSSVILVCPLCELLDSNGNSIESDRLSIASSDRRPHRRLSIVIRNITYVTQHYGFFVRDLLQKTRLNGSYASSDYVLTAEVAMLGEIREIPEILIRRRVEMNSGTKAVLHSQKAWADWLDPKYKRNRTLLPLRERLALEYLHSVLYLPLKAGEKILCSIEATKAHYGRILAIKLKPWYLRLDRNRNRVKRLFHI